MVESGSGTVYTDTGVHTVFRGSMMLFSPGLRHRIDTSVETPMQFIYVHFDGVGRLPFPQFEHPLCSEVRLRELSPVHHLQAADAFIQLSRRFLQEWSRVGPGRNLLLTALLLEWLALLTDELESGQEGFSARRRMGILRNAIVANPAARWCLRDMSAICGIGPDTLAREAMRHTGERPTWFRDRIRVEEAKRLLAETSLSIQEVLSCCGWEDPLYGSRRFRQLTGLSPTGWRNSQHS